MSELKKLGDFATIGSGYAFSSDAFSEDGIPIIRMSDLCNGFVDIKHAARVSQTKGLDGFKLNQGDFLIGMSGSLDAYGVVGADVTIAYLNQRVGRLSIKDPKKAHYGFFAKVLSSDAYRKYVYREGIGAAQLNISSKQIECFEMYVPEYDIQEKIFQILDTIDTAIQQTQAIINKLKQLKQGLLHDLLTRGVDAKGELRPCYDDAPHLYKESPLGWIPKEWEVTQVGNEVSIEHGFAFAGGLFTNEPIGPVLLVPGNFHRDGELYFTPHNTKYFTGKYPKETVLSRGDLLVVMTDLSPMTLILGRTAILQEKHLVLHNQRIGKYIFKSKKDWSTSFFSSFMNDDRVRTRIIAEATGTTVRHTSPERIKDCYIAKPSLDEQKKIDSHLLAIHTRLDLEKNNLLKLIQQKTALMDDLLTGRIRVTSLLQTEASSV